VVFLSLSALLLEELSFHRYTKWREILKLTLYAILENFGYRQLTLMWRCRAMIDYFRGVKHVWGEMQRASFSAPPPSPD